MIQLSLLSSGADFGTRSISASYRKLIQFDTTHEFKLGFRKMGIRGWLEGRRFINQQHDATLLCLFNAPILLAAIFGNKKNFRCVAVLDWTESFPSLKRNAFTGIYDRIYLWAFSRLSAVYSPSKGFCDYYNQRGASILPCLYPLPKEIPTRIQDVNPSLVKLLFVGADFRRKGGDILLQTWKQLNPTNATLTFVCPNPPEENIPNVTFLKNIKAGTTEQEKLFQEHDIFILPTHEEPFGFALLEAINAGMCAITTEAAGAAQVVRDSGGLVFPTAAESCHAAINLTRNPDQLSAIKNQCLKFLPDYQHAVECSLEKIMHSTKSHHHH